ncbi:type II secretion system F family protein [Candidatus Dependentiae bacterium]|nr:type II secretion system F family protein [Candidatus Dependentiae bacterium]
MPYFKWRGVNLAGNIKKGRLFAYSQDHLDSLLFKRDIALLSCSPASCYFTKAITLQTKIQFFKQLSSLVRSGLLVHDALHIICQQMSNIRFQEIALTLAQETQKGKSLHTILENYPNIFDTITITMCNVGQQSGTIADIADSISHYLNTKEQFHKQLRSGAIMPFITLLFFAFVLLVIFIGVIPRFADIFASSNKPLPSITQIMIRVSSFLRSWSALIFACCTMTLFIGIKNIAYKSGKHFFDQIILYMPLLGTITQQKAIVHFSIALSLLLNSGMQLAPAIAVAKKAVANTTLEKYIDIINSDVAAGNTLSDAMARQQEWFGQESIAMISIAQKSGNISAMLRNIAELHEKKINHMLSFITKIFQPLLMIILGLLVTALLFSIYLPIFSLSEVVGFN